ncbi:MAG TPA: SDR family NAD(P)-dependent oxidoreductase [Acidimicrobiales bacterium]|nr:SDR family NAD(P)-dependent oxidoreductase [Acidimicrobiales bacterium]
MIRDLTGKTAVVTGAASGIGFALASRFVAEGARVALADVEATALEDAAAKLRAEGGEVLPVVTDVSQAEAVAGLAARVATEFGPVHVLCNNAGVGAGGLIADLRLEDWQWVLGVNMWGVIHGLHAFLPGMLEHGEEGHIVNTASLAGHVSAPFMAPYGASKFAVVAISESLFHELALTNAKIGVSVLCPGWVNTNIHASERNRPEALRSDAAPFGAGDPRAELLKQVLTNGMAPSEVATLVFDAATTGRFYVLTHPEMTPAVEARMQSIIAGDNPQLSAVF